MQKFINWLIGKPIRTIVLLLIILAIAVLIKTTTTDSAVEEVSSQESRQVVTLITPAEHAGEQTLILIGTVRSLSEAKVTADTSGRVVSVPVSLGQTVVAGTVIATLENASERAAVLQAEGIYEAAVAAATQTNLGVSEANTMLSSAQNSAVSAIRSAYNTSNNVVISSIDSFFSNPDGTVPGLRIDGRGFTAQLNTERVALQTLLPEWSSRANNVVTSDDLTAELAYARMNTERILSTVDIFISIFGDGGSSGRYSKSELQEFAASFTALRANLISVLSSLDAAGSGLEAAADAIDRASAVATGGTASAADAQIKQALGGLRSAQANLAKTILRTPISGTVSALPIRTGDFVGNAEQVALVTNSNGKEIVTYITERDKSLVGVGKELVIEGLYPATVTEVSSVVDPNTRKIEVRLATDALELIVGDTVRLTKEYAIANAEKNTIPSLPISAIRFDAKNGSVLLVENGFLVERTVELGLIRGGSVEITEGIKATDAVVADARGLEPGIAVVTQ